MRVDFTNLGSEPLEKSKLGRAGQAGTAASAASNKAASAADTNSGTDQASLSFDLGRVQALESKVLAAPEVRQEKVGPLQQAVASGGYQVDPGKVADAIMADATGGTIR